MIDEEELRQLLRAGAESYGRPEEGPAAVLRGGEGMGPATASQPWWRRPLVPVAAGVVVIAVLAGLVTGTEERRGTDMTAGDPVERRAPVQSLDDAGPSVTTTVVPPPVSGDAVASGQSSSTNYGNTGDAGNAPGVAGSDGSVTVRPPTAGPLATLDTVNAKVVKTGSVDLEVPKGDVSLTVSRLSALAVGVSGFIADSRTSESASAPRGTVTLRVPAASYEGVVEEVRRLGKVISATSQGRDVTDQFTDLESRIRALEATRAQYLALLGRAQSIQEILSVQTQVNQVQVQLEQLQGQRNALEDQASFAALAVSFTEPGARRPENPRSGMAEAWHKAVDGFLGGLEAIVAASGAILVWLLALGALALAAAGVWTVARRRVVWARAGEPPPSTG